MKILFLVSLIVSIINAQSINCKATASDGSTYDLTPLMDSVLSQNDATVQFSYDVHICKNDLTCGGCTGTGGYCQTANTGSPFRYCVGKVANGQLTGKTGGQGVELVYNNGDSGRMGRVTINCKPGPLIGKLTAISPATDITKFEFHVDSSAGCPVGGGSPHWSIEEENEFLVLRDISTPGDHRIAFLSNESKDYSTPIIVLDQNRLLESFTNWKIEEENGVLVIRDINHPGDHRFAFYPACGNTINFGNIVPGSSTGVVVYYHGIRWVIQEENGILVFRDTLTPGDHRIAFFPNSYINM